MSPPSDRIATWAAGIADELAFWDAWLAGRGLQWPEDYRHRLDPAAPLDPAIAAAAAGLDQGGRLRVLDVGAGPLTMVGHVLPGIALEVTATDALAPLYAALLARHGITPPVATRFAPTEHLAALLPAADFDVVHCRNALDHAIDPVLGILEMLRVVRIGGRVLLRHFRNEGEAGDYRGLHQWNFDVRDGRFVIADRAGAAVDVAAALPAGVALRCRADAGVEVELDKLAAIPPEPPAAAAARLGASLARCIAALGPRA